MDLTKTVIKPIKVIARHDSIHGFLQEYNNVSQDVFLLEGELHLGRKPGFLLYTTEEARDNFARIVLQDVRASERVHALAEKAVSRMNTVNDGSTWMAAHMRRGDCKRFFIRVLCSLLISLQVTTLGWAMEAKIEGMHGFYYRGPSTDNMAQY